MVLVFPARRISFDYLSAISKPPARAEVFWKGFWLYIRMRSGARWSSETLAYFAINDQITCSSANCFHNLCRFQHEFKNALGNNSIYNCPITWITSGSVHWIVTYSGLHENICFCLFSIFIMSLSCLEQTCSARIRFERCF